MREITLDTETTGLDHRRDDRVVEIGAVELINHIPTGQIFHCYINPQRSMPVEAFNVHGLSEEFLSDKPVFADIVEDFLAFIDGARLIAHNATFDMNFLNAELARLELPPIPGEVVVDSLVLARRRHPAGPNSLDNLCSRYGIDNSRRTKHGALLDAELLAEVYIELIGGRQALLTLDAADGGGHAGNISARSIRPREAPLPTRLTEAEREAHLAFIGEMGEKALWRKYLGE
ncbi:MAG: DNA polymerase III subunit epsilon [Hyphomicrobiales bacterium]